MLRLKRYILRLITTVGNKTVLRYLNWKARNSHLPPSRVSVISELNRRAIVSSADFVEAKMPQALFFENKPALWDFAISKRVDGLIMEFGVYTGNSTNHFAKKIGSSTLYAFDSFEGLDADWKGAHLPEGAFDLGGKIPSLRSNVTPVKGFFNDSLPGFLERTPGKIGFMHIDSDTYEAASVVLDLTHPRLQSGTVILFDEYLGYPGWKLNEHKAWVECSQAHDIAFEYVAFSSKQVMLIVR